MPRIGRLINNSESTVYHVMSRTALDGFPMGDREKECFLNIIKRYSKLFFVDIIGFALLDNHFLCGAQHKKCYVQFPVM